MADPLYAFELNDARQLLRLLTDRAPVVAQELEAQPYVRFYRFTMVTDFVDGVASINLSQLDGTATGLVGQMKAGMTAFEELVSGDTGQCFYQDGYYWVSNADCPS